MHILVGCTVLKFVGKICFFIIHEVSKLYENTGDCGTAEDDGLSHLMRQGPFVKFCITAFIFIAVVPNAIIQKVGLMTSCKYLCLYILN